MTRSGADAAYIWVTEPAEWDAFRRATEIDQVSRFHPARYLFRVIRLEQGERATEREVATYFGFEDYATISRDWVVGFVEEVTDLWDSVGGDQPPDGWDEC